MKIRNLLCIFLTICLTACLGNVNIYRAEENAAKDEVVTEVSAGDGKYGKTMGYASSREATGIGNIKAAGGDFGSATSINLGNTINDSITETIDSRMYQFTMTSSGRLTFHLTSYMEYCTICIYESDGTEIWYDDNNKWNENLKYRKDTYEIDLKNGTYFLKVTGYRYRNGGSKATGKYTLETKFESAGESCAEPNNDFMEASEIGINGTVKGQIAENDMYDIYKFFLSEPGRIGLTMTSYMRYNSIYLYDDMGEEIWISKNNEWNENLKYKTNTYDLDLAGGSYYLKVTGHHTSRGDSTGNYTFKMKYTAAKTNYKEPNNDFSEAYALKTDTTLRGQIAIDDPHDILKFSLPKARNIKITITSYMPFYTLDLYDSAGERIWYTNQNEWNAGAGYRKDTHTVSLSAGDYYLKVTGSRYSNVSSGSTGTYTLRVGAKASVADASVYFLQYQAYTGKAVQPSVTVKYDNETLKKGKDYEISYKNNRKIGDAVIVIKGKGKYTGTRKAAFYIVPKTASITKAQNSGKGTVTLKWKRDESVSGYKIYRSANKNSGFVQITDISKNKTVSFKDKNLQKGKTYYYKVRSYKRLNGYIYSGASSKVKAVKIKK